MLIDYEEKTYLFYEAVDGVKGHIEVSEVQQDCSISDSVIVLKDTCHYSYPFVFSYNDIWYMVPESSEVEEVRLYKALEFPYKWEMCRILLKGKYVDTTIFEDKGKLYLLTFEIKGITESVKPKAFRFFLNDTEAKLEEIPWDSYNELQVRGAGQITKRNNVLLRPAQVSAEYRYGDALVFNEIDEVDEKYTEHQVFCLNPENIRVKKRYVNGLHTYTVSEEYEAIDIRCRDFDICKPFRKILQNLKRKL